MSFSQQKTNPNVIHSTTLPVQFLGETERLDEFVEAPGTVNEITKNENLGYAPKKNWVGNEFTNPNALPQGDDPVWQQEYAPEAPATKAMGVGWNGMGYSNVNPADPSMDVGPNHVVQMINANSGAAIRIYTKTGTPIGTQVNFDNFMAMPGGAGDPIVLYDERANRWFLSEFSATGNNLHVAISTTPDPGGTYYKYIFNSPGGFPDYPKYSIWENEYVMTANVNTPDIFALNRTAMLAGTPTTAQMFSQSNFGTIGFQASTPVSLNGTTLPPSGQPALLMRMRDDAWSGSASDALEMWELDVDWVTPANSTLSQVQTLPTAPHDSELCGYTSFQCFPQPGSSITLDPLRELLMNRIHYRNFGTHESIVCCHVTDVNATNRGGIRWYELRRTGGTAGTWTIYQQGTYSPDATNRWMPSISISASGNIGLAYSAASTTVHPSLRYTGRKSCDPLGVMTEPETVLMAGTSHNGSNRWGDYFQLNCDASDGETFYHTGCYNVAVGWSTRISKFTIDPCSPLVSFNASTYSVNEGTGTTPNATNACLPYVDVIVPISIGSAPTQNASIVVSATGGTATNNVDYTVLNGTLTLNSSNLTANVTVRVYNDDYVEANETIILTYTLNANGGNAVAGTLNQTVTVTIADDDLTPAASTNTSTILSYGFESGFGTFSTVNPSGATAWQVGNAAAASTGAFTVPNTNATNFAWINDDACNCNQNNVDLVFPSVNLTGFSAASLAFSSYFEDGTYQGINENANVFVSVNGGADVLVGPLVASSTAWVNQNFSLTPYVGNANVVVKVKYSDATGWLYGCTVDNVLITGQGPINVQSAVNTGAGMSGYLGPNGTVHFYDPSGDVMMSLTNSTSFNYGCVTVEVDRAGTSALQFNNSNPANYLHSKTFRVIPTNANPTGSYNVTLYYKEAEVAGWEAATGNVRSAAKIVKVSGNNQILSVNPGNAGTFTIGDATTTIGNFNGNVTFTAPFTTGFSGFGVGVYNPVSGSAPVANFSGTPTSICAGQSVAFTDLSTNAPTGWLWNFGDATTSTLQNPSHVYTTAGNYTVTLTATNGNGSDPHTLTNYITVNPIPAITSTKVNSTNCSPVNGTMTISGTGTGVVNWTGTTSGTSGTVTLPYTITGLGAGSYTATFTSAAGCASNTTSQSITIPTNPVIAGTGNNPTACATTTGSIAVTGSGTGVVSWSGTASGSSGTVTLPYTITGLGAGSYAVTFTSSGGCVSNTSNYTLTNPTPPNVTASGTATICAGQSTPITAGGATTYSWNNGAGTNASATVSPTTTTTYTVTGTTAGCTNTASVTITVTPLPNVTASGTASICPGQSTPITAGGASTYSWDNGAGTSASATVSPASTTTYTVTGTASGCSNTAAVTITVNPIPSVSIAGTTTICPGQSTTLTASGATTYSWDNGAGSAATATVSPATTTTYTVTGTSLGCSGTQSVTVVVGSNTASTQSVGLCPGESITVGSNTYTSAGTYTDVFALGAGCDSTVTTIVTELAATSSTETVEICEGSSYTILGNTYTASGTYTNMTTNAAGCDSTITTILTVNPNPIVSILPTVIDTLCESSEALVLVGTPGGGTFSGNGISGSVFEPSVAGIGTHVITYAYTDANGCNGETTVIAIVDECANGIGEVGLANVTLFPNPNEGLFTITGLAIGTEYEIFDETGRLVVEGVTKSMEQEVQLKNVQTGVYYLYATQNGVRGSVKFLITK